MRRSRSGWCLHIAMFERLMREPTLRRLARTRACDAGVSTARSAAVEHLLRASEELRARSPMRLVKGAYWDAEIKRAQELGMAGFPVFTRKWATDVSFLTVARLMLLNTVRRCIRNLQRTTH